MRCHAGTALERWGTLSPPGTRVSTSRGPGRSNLFPTIASPGLREFTHRRSGLSKVNELIHFATLVHFSQGGYLGLVIAPSQIDSNVASEPEV